MKPSFIRSNHARRPAFKTAVSQPRAGAAVVELAVLIPVLFTVAFGTLEVCNRMYLRQTASVAAYEGARLAARRTITQAQVEARCMDLLTGRRVVGGTVTITPGNNGLATLPTGGQLQVEVTIPISGNTPVSYVLSSAGMIRSSAYMLRE